MKENKPHKIDSKLNSEDNLPLNINNSSLIIYQTEDGQTKIQTRLENETVWLTIEQMAELFQKVKSTINEHILNIYKEGELEKDTSLRKIGNSDFSTKPLNSISKCNF